MIRAVICSGMGVRCMQKIRDGVLVLDCMSLSLILLHATAIWSSPCGTAIPTFFVCENVCFGSLFYAK